MAMKVASASGVQTRARSLLVDPVRGDGEAIRYACNPG